MSDIVEELREYAIGSSLPVERELIEKTVAEITRLRAENERLEDTRIEFIGMINKLIDERVKMRKALNPFAANARHFKDDCKDTLVVQIGVDVGYLRAAAAAIRESGE